MEENHPVMISLCSGIGAFELAAKTAFPNITVGFSEVKKTAISIHKKQFPDSYELGDLSKISQEQIDHVVRDSTMQIVVAGFPCQNISMVNSVTRTGLKGASSSLFYHVLRVIQCVQKSKTCAKKNVRVIIENVRGNADTMKTITNELQQVVENDTVSMTTINSALFCAQQRIRNFWTNFPLKKRNANQAATLSDVLLPMETVMERLQEVQLSAKFVSMYNKIITNEKVAKHTVQVSLKSDSNGVLLWQREVLHGQPRARWQKYPFSDTALEKSTTITTNHPNHHLIDRRVPNTDEEVFVARKFFPEELERLFEFPVGWTETGCEEENLSLRERTDLLGNSIVVPVAIYLLQSIES